MKTSEKSDLIQICIIYRYVSLAVSTFVYYSMHHDSITSAQFITMGAMVVVSLIAADFYYRKYRIENKKKIAVAICLENLCYGIFIAFSGGLKSPYLWYFVSALAIVIAAEYLDKHFRRLSYVSVLWCFFCAIIGTEMPYSFHILNSNMNISIVFLTVTAGFYILFVYVCKMDRKGLELNQSLKHEIIRNEQVFQSTIDLYESLNLFSIVEPKQAIDKIISLIHSTIAPNGCLLIRINLHKKIDILGIRGFSKETEEALIKYVLKFKGNVPMDICPEFLEIKGEQYRISYLNNIFDNQDSMIILYKTVYSQGLHNKSKEIFYLNVARMVMQELSFHSIEESHIISEEQNRIASEIHDTVIQKLFAIVCSLRFMYDEQEEMSVEESRDQLKSMMKATESTMRELREAIYSFRWNSGEQGVFEEKLSSYIEEVECLSGTQVALSLSEKIQLMTSNQKTTCYRIICEAVNNAIRHGGALNIWVKMDVEEDQLRVEVRDNGKGFDYKKDPQNGQGLKNMYRMTYLLGGQLQIESNIDAGTKIICSFPMWTEKDSKGAFE